MGKKVKRKLGKAESSARRMVGDGKLPNKYWVSWHSDFLVQSSTDDGSVCMSWASEVLKGFKPVKIPNSTERFDTFTEAKKRAEELVNEIYANEHNPQNNTINFVVIEDRFSGEVFSGGLHAYPNKGILGGYDTEVESRSDDTAFTEKAMKKLGAVFK